MSSAEVFCWGSLGPVPGEGDNPAPVEAGRSGLVRQVYAGPTYALLGRAKGVKWLPDQVGLGNNNGDGSSDHDSRNLPGVRCAAFGKNHTLLLRDIIGEADDDANPNDTGGETKTEVLAWGSGSQGQVSHSTPQWVHSCVFRKCQHSRIQHVSESIGTHGRKSHTYNDAVQQSNTKRKMPMYCAYVANGSSYPL